VHTIRIHTTQYSIPSQWDELSADQLRRIAWLSTLKKEGAALSKLFFYILTSSLPWWKRLRLQWFYLFEATTDERGDFVSLVSSFRDRRSLTEQKLKKIRGKSVLLYGPESGLANCTFFEYIQAEKYFLNYMEAEANKNASTPLSMTKPVTLSGVEGWLDRLVATLYRQKRRGFDPTQDSDPRIQLNDIGIRYRLAVVRRIDLSTKLAILMWFDGCRNQMIQRFPVIFPKQIPQEKSKLDFSQPSKGGAGSGWIDMISELAGSPAEYERIGNTNLFTAMTDISYRIKKNQEAKRQHEAAARSRKR
jgi:hypothetical protein